MHSSQQHKPPGSAQNDNRSVGRKAVCLTDNRGLSNPVQRKADSSAGPLPGSYLQDSRAQHSPWKTVEAPATVIYPQPVTQLKQVTTNETVMQLARTKNTVRRVATKKKPKSHRRTMSGHGGLRRDAGALKMFTVPLGKSVMRPAPPGATLGNMSMLLNEQKGLTRDALVKKTKVSTTTELWDNGGVVGMINAEPSIIKTQKQQDVLTALLSGTKFKDLDKGQKLALAALERKKEFETWTQGHVMGETFKTFGGNQQMEDMELTPFEKELRSKKSHNENDYVESATNLSDYVSDPGVNDVVVNACSYDENCPYTGFQIDKK